MSRRRILLLSAYDAYSHRYWRKGLVEHLDAYEWIVRTQPSRNFAWRSRGNALHWAFEQKDLFAEPFDAVVATSMVDLATLRGLVPALGKVYSTVYFHENQFAYPDRPGQKRDVNYGLTNLYTALAADRIAFNSAFNRDSFIEGIDAFLSRMPDQVPAGVTERLAARSVVLPVPLRASPPTSRAAPRTGPLTILWNHRWEYDKAPERFFAALFALAEKGRPFRLHVVGQSFRNQPAIFEEARTRLADHIDTWGFVADRRDYEAVLSRSDLVVSTALHEFQGLAMLEAVVSGCHPLAPRRLAYREFFPDHCLYDSHVDAPAREAKTLTRALERAIDHLDELRRTPVPDLSHLRWDRLRSSYEALLDTSQSL